MIPSLVGFGFECSLPFPKTTGELTGSQDPFTVFRLDHFHGETNPYAGADAHPPRAGDAGSPLALHHLARRDPRRAPALWRAAAGHAGSRRAVRAVAGDD